MKKTLDQGLVILVLEKLNSTQTNHKPKKYYLVISRSSNMLDLIMGNALYSEN